MKKIVFQKMISKVVEDDPGSWRLGRRPHCSQAFAFNSASAFAFLSASAFALAASAFALASAVIAC